MQIIITWEPVALLLVAVVTLATLHKYKIRFAGFLLLTSSIVAIDIAARYFVVNSQIPPEVSAVRALALLGTTSVIALWLSFLLSWYAILKSRASKNR